MARVLAVAAAAIALGSFLGYALNITGLYKWSESGVGMAINTGLCLILLAAAVFMLSLRKP